MPVTLEALNRIGSALTPTGIWQSCRRTTHQHNCRIASRTTRRKSPILSQIRPKNRHLRQSP